MALNKKTPTQNPLTLQEVTALAWEQETICLVGARASGASTVAKIIGLAAGRKVCCADSSNNIRNSEGTGFTQVYPEFAEAQVLLNSTDAQAAGDLQPDRAVIVANLKMTYEQLRRMPKAICVLASGIPRGPKQVEELLEILGHIKMIHVISSKPESFAGSNLRARLGARRSDTSRASLEKAWGIYTGLVCDGVNYFEKIVPPGSLLNLWKVEPLRVKLAKACRFVAPDPRMADHWIANCHKPGHPACEEIEEILDTQPLYDEELRLEIARQEHIAHHTAGQHHQSPAIRSLMETGERVLA